MSGWDSVNPQNADSREGFSRKLRELAEQTENRGYGYALYSQEILDLLLSKCSSEMKDHFGILMSGKNVKSGPKLFFRYVNGEIDLKELQQPAAISSQGKEIALDPDPPPERGAALPKVSSAVNQVRAKVKVDRWTCPAKCRDYELHPLQECKRFTNSSKAVACSPHE